MDFEVTPAANVEFSTFRAALQSRNICSSKTQSVLISVCLLAYSMDYEKGMMLKQNCSVMLRTLK